MSAPVVLITGASSGIGAATVRAFAQADAKLILVARRQEKLEALAQQLESESLVLPADVSQLDALPSIVEKSLDRFGHIDVLFNNAGFGRINWLERLTPAEIDQQVRVNLIGAMALTHQVLPHMLARQRGHIINMASLAGLIGTPMYSVYAATKFALRGFSEALRREVEPFGIKVSVISPGGVGATEFAEQAGLTARRRFTTPRWLRPSADDVARVVVGLVKHPRREVVVPAALGGLAWFNQHLPTFTDWVVETVFTRRVKR
jgi:short-subunit dehydrogenase